MGSAFGPAQPGLTQWVWQWSTFATVSLALQTVAAFMSYLLWTWVLGRYPATRLRSLTSRTSLLLYSFTDFPLTPLIGSRRETQVP